ncbi:MAG: hypothetical protein ABIA75_14840 [Candidatus Neomarinimicrobiota bacterium]
MKQSIQKLLYRSLDVKLSPAEQKLLSDALTDSEQLCLEKQELDQIRMIIQDAKTESFQPFFAERVMTRLMQPDKPATEVDMFTALTTFFKPLGIAATLVLIGLLVYNVSNAGYLSIDTIIGLPEVTIDNIALAIQ